MSAPRPRLFVIRRPVPLWLIAVVIAPLGLVFLTSFLLALGVAGVIALAAGAFPLLRRPSRPRDSDTIELDPSQYRRLGSPPRDDR